MRMDCKRLTICPFAMRRKNAHPIVTTYVALPEKIARLGLTQRNFAVVRLTIEKWSARSADYGIDIGIRGNQGS